MSSLIISHHEKTLLSHTVRTANRTVQRRLFFFLLLFPSDLKLQHPDQRWLTRDRLILWLWKCRSARPLESLRLYVTYASVCFLINVHDFTVWVHSFSSQSQWPAVNSLKSPKNPTVCTCSARNKVYKVSDCSGAATYSRDSTQAQIRGHVARGSRISLYWSFKRQSFIHFRAQFLTELVKPAQILWSVCRQLSRAHTSDK